MVTDLSAKDLCRIIEAGARFNLKSLKMGAVELEFADRGRLAIEDLPKTYQYDLPSPESAGAPNETKQEPKASIMESQLLEDARVSQLMVDDPVAFEQEMIDGFLGSRRQLNADT